MTPKERAMSEPADPGDIWEGIPQSWLDALAAFVAERLRGGPGDAARNHFASLFREAAADQARLDWIEQERVTVEAKVKDFRVWCDDRDNDGSSELSFAPTVRDAIDAARGSVPSPTPNPETVSTPGRSGPEAGGTKVR